MNTFAQSLLVTVLRKTSNSFEGRDGKTIAYDDALVVTETDELYIVRDTKGALETWSAGSQQTANLSPAGKVTKVVVPVLRIARD